MCGENELAATISVRRLGMMDKFPFCSGCVNISMKSLMPLEGNPKSRRLTWRSNGFNSVQRIAKLAKIILF